MFTPSIIDYLPRLDMAGVAGVVVGVLVVMVLGYTCGLLTGLLVVRHSVSTPQHAPAQPDTPAVQLYLPRMKKCCHQCNTSKYIPLQDNVSYIYTYFSY